MTCQTPEDDFVRWDAESVTCIGQNHKGACAPKASLATPMGDWNADRLSERNMEANSRKREKSNGVQNVDRGSENSYRQKEMERHSQKPYTPSGVRN